MAEHTWGLKLFSMTTVEMCRKSAYRRGSGRGSQGQAMDYFVSHGKDLFCFTLCALDGVESH